MSYEGVMTHARGEHKSMPRAFTPIAFGVEEMSGYIIFNEASRYQHGNSDQQDWNKLGGFSHTVKPNGSAVLLAWRYQPGIDSFDVGWYLNYSGANLYGDLFRSGIGDTVVYHVERLHGNQIHYQVGDTSIMVEYPDWGYLVFLRQPWFGGNRPAPLHVSYYIKIEYR
jgi:hypothetical protein